MSAANDTVPSTVSRYRSRRNPPNTRNGPSSSESNSPELQTSPDVNIARSRSRYRRNNVDVSSSRKQTIPIPPLPQLDSPQQGTSATFRTGRSLRYKNRPNPESPFTRSAGNVGEEKDKALPGQRSLPARSTSTSSVTSPDPTQSRHDNTRALSPAEYPKEIESVLLDGPPASSQIRATKPDEIPAEKEESRLATCFGIFRRRRPTTPPPQEQRFDSSLSSPESKDAFATIKVGGGGIVPGTDAPMSAVNAGDRHVSVECGKSTMLFPVTPDTTPVDLIKSASTVMSEQIDVRNAILKEHFGTAGLQRRLRRYEHVRDVMNSWNNDRQNSLLLVHAEQDDTQTELTIDYGSIKQPPEGEWLLQCSQKMGKWERRVIVLKSDGQITSAKDSNKSQIADNLCHLSDFDIYSPTADRSRREIKPPKQYCHAIKSQQKTAMFESTDNFVHFFSHGDKKVIDSFYACVQQWRSWYLVNIMGEGKRMGSQTTNISGPLTANLVTSGHKKQDSFSSHYQLGSFQPLMDMKIPFDDVTSPTIAQPILTSPKRAGLGRHSLTKVINSLPKPLAEDEPLANLVQGPLKDVLHKSPPLTKKQPEEFASKGLLGHSYSQRRHDVELREAKNEGPSIEGPFIVGPNLLNSARDRRPNAPEAEVAGLERRETRRRGGVHGKSSTQEARTRASDDMPSAKRHSLEQSKPLVDLTPRYHEVPQHNRKGRGFKPDPSSVNGTLIDNATSPQEAIHVPPSTEWRDLGVDERKHSQSTYRPRARTLTTREPERMEAFQSDGLLAHAQNGWGGATRGRRYMDGAHAKGPMLDVQDTNQFVHGSLLNRIQSRQGKEGPTIDREKRVERDEKVGEGF